MLDVAEPPETADGTEASHGRANRTRDSRRTRDHRRADRDPGDAGGEGAGTRERWPVTAIGLLRGAGTGSVADTRCHGPPRATSG